ncbi:MAG: hypothetical protein WC342_00565 [Methanoregula sp.]|jgi:hypothetical protein
MDLPALNPGEEWLVRSSDVYIKSAPYAAFLTTSRIIIRSAGKKAQPDSVLFRESVVRVHAATSEFGEPVLTIETRDRAGNMRKIVLTFSGRAGSTRIHERDQWARIISEHPGPDQAPAPEECSRHAISRTSEKAIAYDDRKLTFHDGIHHHSATRQSVSSPGDAKTRENPDNHPPRDFPGSGPGDRSCRIKKPEILVQDPSCVPKKSRDLPVITKVDEPDKGSGKLPEPAGSHEDDPVCRQCGKTLFARSRFCSYCGTPVTVSGTGTQTRSGVMAARPAEKISAASRTGPVKSPAIRFIDPPGRMPVPAGPDFYGHAGEFREFSGKCPAGSAGSCKRTTAVSHSFTGYRKIAAVLVLLCAVVVIVAVGGLYQYFPVVGGNSTGVSTASPAPLQKNAVTVPVTTLPLSSPSGISAGATGLPTITTIAISSGTEAQSNSDPLSQDLNFIVSCKCGVYVRVVSAGSWSGTYGLDGDMRTASYSGEKIFQIENAQGAVSASFQKEDSSAQDLSVQIYNNGNLVASGSSSDSNGSVSITADV